MKVDEALTLRELQQALIERTITPEEYYSMLAVWAAIQSPTAQNLGEEYNYE